MKIARCFFVVFTVALATRLPAQTTPLRIEQTVEARFPAALALSPLSEGEARVLICVDADGQLADLLVTGYTHQAFADEAVSVLREWRYTAPTEHGEPVGVRTELKFEFKATGRIISLLVVETPEVLLRQMGILPHLIARVCAPQELDRPIAPVHQASPLNPREAGASTGPQSVVVDFYVDEHGQPRMPVVIKAPHPVLAQAAVGALSQWRFTAPTRAGKPVAVRVRQEFIFPGRS